ncbi:MAG: acetate kinase [Bacteroides sp.]|nr:acetate kinase [Bacteroides sp.]MCM1085695.1 acetate kinase [Bacteroides sp.]
MKILVLNCGSSSLKYQLLDMEQDGKVLAKGLVEKIGLAQGSLTHQGSDGEKHKFEKPVPDHQVGINWVLEYLVHPQYGVIKDLKEIEAVGHRVVHGGETFKDSVLIDQRVMDALRACIPFAPLHNPANIKGIESMQALLPEVPQVGVFDTSFHQTMPDYAYMYAVPYKFYQTDRMRRYGFHGTSHKFVVKKAAKLAGIDIEHSKIISCHLGNGASVAAVLNGKSVDTSMGYTPVEGLMMGTRAGDLDLGAAMAIMEKEHLSPEQANNYFSKECGLQGVSQFSSDMRDLRKAASEGNAQAALALRMFAYRVKKYVGAYAAALGGVDLILFTGGIGENDADARRQVCEGMEFMGVEFDAEKNAGIHGQDALVSRPGSRVKVAVVTTDEEKVIATDTMNIINRK